MSGYSLDHAGLETLNFDTCLRCWRRCGRRVGFVADGEVQILPVNHLVDGQDVVFRTATDRNCPRRRDPIRSRSRPTPMTSGKLRLECGRHRAGRAGGLRC